MWINLNNTDIIIKDEQHSFGHLIGLDKDTRRERLPEGYKFGRYAGSYGIYWKIKLTKQLEAKSIPYLRSSRGTHRLQTTLNEKNAERLKTSQRAMKSSRDAIRNTEWSGQK